jgi:hypothetical protein
MVKREAVLMAVYLVADFILGLKPKALHVGFVVNKVAL